MKPNYWQRNKHQLLPQIKDWSSPHNEIRHSNNVKAMTYNEWLYLHPSAYKLIYYGTDSIGITIFGISAAFLAHKGANFTAILLTIFSLAFLLDLIKKIINRKHIEDLTLYDMFMREYGNL